MSWNMGRSNSRRLRGRFRLKRQNPNPLVLWTTTCRRLDDELLREVSYGQIRCPSHFVQVSC